jgi:hypothetical protein
MPKSITLGPTRDRRTLLGLRSRWTTPAAWMPLRAAAMPMARLSSVELRIGPSWSRAAVRVGPSMNSVTR